MMRSILHCLLWYLLKSVFFLPLFILGMQRIYSKEVDSPSLKNNQHLVRSVPDEFKQSLKQNLKPLGFTGYKLSELTPNLTRRAQCSNWLLYYREELFGYTLEELQERRRLKKEQEEGTDISGTTSQDVQSNNSDKDGQQHQQQDQKQKPWKPPVTEVF
jgi:SIT4 phosphatase-associated protein